MSLRISLCVKVQPLGIAYAPKLIKHLCDRKCIVSLLQTKSSVRQATMKGVFFIVERDHFRIPALSHVKD